MPKLALSMIVRDAASTLRGCLNSVKNVVDELVIADTGSVDNTPAIAREFGARVIHIPWKDDFAAARNQALAEVTADWVLSLDADEILDADARHQISDLLITDVVGGYQVTIRNYMLSLEDRIWDRPAKPNDSRLPAAQGYPAYVEHENVRLFRKAANIFFVGRVHESVGSTVEGSGLRLGRAPFLIHHFGLAADAEQRARKNAFYRDLGRQKIVEMPEHPQAHLELGLVELDNFGNIPEALKLFERACALNPKLGVAWFFAGLAHLKLGEHREAVRCLKNAQKQGHLTSFVCETAGDAHYNLGEFPQAVRAYTKALESSPNGLLLESKLGLAIVRVGRVDKGLGMIRDAVEQQPSQPELHDRLILSLAWLGRLGEAAAAAEAKLQSVRQPLPSDFLRAATLRANLNDWQRVAAVLHVGTMIYPKNDVLKQALTETSGHMGTQMGEVIEKLTREVQVRVPN